MKARTSVIEIPKMYVGGAIANSVIEFFEKGEVAIEAVEKVLKYINGKESDLSAVMRIKDVKLLSPIANPPKVIALAGNYISHVRDVRKDRPLPRGIMLVGKSTGKFGVVGPKEDIFVPNTITKLDYELELGARAQYSMMSAIAGSLWTCLDTIGSG